MADEEVTRIGLLSVGSLLSPLSHYLKCSSLWLDNVVFRLHSRVTAFMLLACSIFTSVGQMFGDPIDCVVSAVGISRLSD